MTSERGTRKAAARPKAAADVEWLTPPQCAAEGQHGVKVIYGAVKRGDLRAARIGGRRDLRIHRTWYREWLERSANPVEAA